MLGSRFMLGILCSFVSTFPSGIHICGHEPSCQVRRKKKKESEGVEMVDQISADMQTQRQGAERARQRVRNMLMERSF
jgi:hypothetical protein